MSSNLLSRRLQECLRSGAFDDVTLAREMNLAIGKDTDDPSGFEVPARRSAVVAMSAAMARELHRHRRAAVRAGHFILARRLGRLGRTIIDWGSAMLYSTPDPDADMLRIRSLQLQLSLCALPEARSLRPAAAAMARVGLAGTSPIH